MKYQCIFIRRGAFHGPEELDFTGFNNFIIKVFICKRMNLKVCYSAIILLLSPRRQLFS